MVKVKLKRLKSELLSRAIDKMKLKLLEAKGSLYAEDNDQSHWLYLVPDYYWLNPYSYDAEEHIFSFNGMQILRRRLVQRGCYFGVLRGTSEADILEKLMNNEELFFEDPRDQDVLVKFKSIAYGKTPEQLEIELDLDGEDNGQR